VTGMAASVEEDLDGGPIDTHTVLLRLDQPHTPEDYFQFRNTLKILACRARVMRILRVAVGHLRMLEVTAVVAEADRMAEAFRVRAGRKEKNPKPAFQSGIALSPRTWTPGCTR